MKKICLVLILFISAINLNAQIMVAKVLSVSGKVETRKNGDSEWQTVNQNDVLNLGDMISTGFKSSATIKIDNSVIEVTPLTRLSLTQLMESDDKRTTTVFLDSGNIKANIKSSDNKRVNFSVSTTVATASVRGTAGTVSALGDVTSTENVWSTSIIYSDGNTSEKQISVAQGMSTTIDMSTSTVSSPIVVTNQNDIGISPILHVVSNIESEAEQTAFVSNLASDNNALNIPTGSDNVDPTCKVLLNVTYSHQ